MIIRHDLELVFLHVPKCAGTRLRHLFGLGAAPGALERFWNYGHSEVLERYVDFAHLPMSDLCTMKASRFLERYTVVASIRNPYKRLRSATNEYYRQKSKRHERLVQDGLITPEQRRRYYNKLAVRHTLLDPRFIHSLPIHRFTHLGSEPQVDHLLHCEHLQAETEQLINRYDWPAEMKAAVADLPATDRSPEPTAAERHLADQLYCRDFQCFGYPQQTASGTTRASEGLADAGQVRWIHNATAVSWHWGPTAAREDRPCLPVRTRIHQ